jgi:hypothetical protein
MKRHIAAPRRHNAVVLALVGIVGAFGWAEPAHADDATEAKLRFDRGVAFINSGRVRRALDEFFVSNRLSPNPTATYNVAACLEALDRLDEAYSTYASYLQGFKLSDAERQSGTKAVERILPKVARLSVLTTPSGAAIFVDRLNLGQYGVTPRTLAHVPGKRTVIVKLSGFHPAERKVTLVTGQQVQVEISLEAIQADVRVESTPPGATIRADTADGSVLGRTPTTLQLAVGERRLILSLDGYEPRREVVDVAADATATIDVGLRKLPAPTGRLRVLTNVANALVRVDKSAAGYTPLVVELPTGTHDLSVERRGFTTWSGPVDISPARPLIADVTLRKTKPAAPVGIWKWVLGATAVTAGLLGAATGRHARSVASDFDDDPTRSRFDDVGRLNAAADALFGVALLTGVATTVLLLAAGTPSVESTVDLTEGHQE